MSSLLIGLLIIFVLLPVVILAGTLLIGTIYYLVSAEQESQHAWRTFATKNNLNCQTFLGLSPTLRVVGEYRNHQFELTSSSRNVSLYSFIYDDQATTKITLETNQLLSADNTFKRPVLSIETAIDYLQMGFNEGEAPVLQIHPVTNLIVFEELGVVTDIDRLQYLFNWLADLADEYANIIAVGGELVPSLVVMMNSGTKLERQLAWYLTAAIGSSTQRELQKQVKQLLCINCYARCSDHKVSMMWPHITTYYGCRICHQSRQFYRCKRSIAVLDEQMQIDVAQEDETLLINWLIWRKPCDFGAIRIIDATDEDVERFVVQMSNDVDVVRRERLSKILCRVSATHTLSENTMRILERTFENVKIA